MKKLKCWKKSVPQWVEQFNHHAQLEESDFFSWLQFVYLPNILTRDNTSGGMRMCSIADQCGKFLKPGPENRRLIQLLVELDSLLF